MSKALTVIMTVFNGMPHLPAAVESILKQTLSDFDFIIVNDGSKDESAAYLSSLSDPRIKLVHQINSGQGASINKALSMCETEYAAYMDADDISLPRRLQIQFEFMKAHPQVVMLGSQINFLVGQVTQKGLSTPLDHGSIQARLLHGHAGVCHPSLMIRTETALKIGGYPAWPLGLDLEFCLRMCEEGQVANVEEILYLYRFHANQTSSAKYRNLISANRYAAYRACCRRDGVAPSSLEAFLANASMIDRWRWSTEAWTLLQYRTARIQLACGKPVQGLLRMGLFGVCRPFSTLHRVSRMAGEMLRGQTA